MTPGNKQSATVSAQELLKAHGLRDTQPRRLVLKAMMSMKKPASHQAIHRWITKHDATINLVTVYRTLDAFEKIGLVHRHLRSGGFIPCSLRHETGHHILLSCEDCGKVEECTDGEFCSHENRIAKRNGFSPTSHFSELIGVCSSCS